MDPLAARVGGLNAQGRPRLHNGVLAALQGVSGISVYSGGTWGGGEYRMKTCLFAFLFYLASWQQTQTPAL